MLTSCKEVNSFNIHGNLCEMAMIQIFKKFRNNSPKLVGLSEGTSFLFFHIYIYERVEDRKCILCNAMCSLNGHVL